MKDKNTDELHRLLGSFVLQLLENETEWSADTIDEIARAAFDMGAAYMDKEGNFKAAV